MMEKLPSGAIDVSKPPQPYTPHLKKVLKTYQKSAIKSLQGPSTVLSDSTSPSSSSSSLASVKKEPESSPELALETPPPVAPPMPQVPILSAADQSAELSNTYVEGHRVACFIIGGEKRICFPQLLSSVLRNVPAYTINNVSTELHINFSSCNSEQLIALKQEGLLPAETPTCGLVTKPDAERLCSVLLHEGGAAPDDLDKHGDYSFLVYHECFSGAKGVLYYQFYTERNWCVQCVICRRLFTPQMFVAHSCCMDKKRNSVHTYIEPGICHWGFDSANWRLYIHVVEEQPDFEKFTKIMEAFKSQHRRSELMPLKRKQELNENAKLTKSVIEELPSTPKVEHNDDDDEERWYMKKKAKMVPAPAPAAPATTEGSATVPCSSLPAYYNTFSEFYTNFCDNWVRTAAAVASYQPPSAWTPYSSLPFPKDSKAYYFPDAVPPFLAQDPPVLLHPERVVPLSQSEQFERSYQPNVALAPPTKTSSDGITYSKLKRGVIRVKNEMNSPAPNDETTPSYFNKDARLDKADIKPPISPVNSSLHASASPRSSPVTEPVPDSGVNNSVVEQVAAVLDALSDAEDAVRQRVIHLVERLTVRIDRCDVERRKYQEEISHLQGRLLHSEEQNAQLAFINSQLRIQLESKHLPPHPEALRPLDDKDGIPLNRSSTPSRKCSTPAGVRLIGSSVAYSPATHNTPGISSKQPNCSPVSVITSPPPLTVIKSESA